MRVSGLVLAVLAMVLLTVARFQLGNAFSITSQAKTLVTRGIYSRIRHPVCIFGAVTIAGLILYSRQPIFLVVLLAVVPTR